jgi:hypothetical protein
MTAQSLAERIGVDTKTVERWISTGRVPYTRAATAAAAALEEDPVFLWPTLHRGRAARSLSSEIVAVYEQRSSLAPAQWQAFFSAAKKHVDILVYAAVFLHEQIPGFNEILRQKAESGCAIRIALGDPTSPNVVARGHEEKFGHGIESRCELALLHFRPLLDTPNVKLRQHDTTLYDSLYRVDDDLMVNGHIFGINAFSAPVWHLRRGASGSLADTYQDSFEMVWERARPVE